MIKSFVNILIYSSIIFALGACNDGLKTGDATPAATFGGITAIEILDNGEFQLVWAKPTNEYADTKFEIYADR